MDEMRKERFRLHSSDFVTVITRQTNNNNMREPTTKKKKANVDASKPHEARENDTPEFVKKQIELAMMAVLEKRGAEKTC